jgi:arylsulfatase A-like enzyme
VDIEAKGQGQWWARPAGKAMSALDGNLLPYKEEVAYTDLHIGRLLAFIEEKKLWENTCVVFVADHGEEFFEHGGAGHDNTLFEELIHVPLAIATPSIDLPDVISQPVGTRWLFGSLLELLGIPSPDTLGGAPSLFAVEDIGGEEHVRSSTRPRGRTGVEGSLKPTIWLSSLTGKRDKLIEDHLRGRTMYFDLLRDPGELADLSERQPETTARLRRMLAARNDGLLDMGETGAAATVSEDELQRLKSLGYL